jgi:hypothetical protein
MTIHKPMLAHKYDDSRVDWSQPVYIQPKLDGVRCLITQSACDFPGVLGVNNLKHIESHRIYRL